MESTTTSSSSGGGSERKRRRPSGAAPGTNRSTATATAKGSRDVQHMRHASDTLHHTHPHPADANGVATAAAAVAGACTDDEAKEKSERALHAMPSDANSSVVGMQGSHDLDDRDNSSDDDSDEEEDDVLVVLELADFKNHPIFDDYTSIRLEGIDTASPVLHIGEYTLYGQLEETVGTNFFYDTNKKRAERSSSSGGSVNSSSKSTSASDGAYQYVGQTTKKIRFTIAPPPEP